MIEKLKKIIKKEQGLLVFNENGRLVRLDKKETEVFNKYCKLKNMPKDISNEDKDVLKRLCNLELIDYEDYTPKEIKKEYTTDLYYANSPEPIYEAPILAHLAITKNCNMRCLYCSVRQAHKRDSGPELTTEQWKRIIKNLSDWGVFQIGFTGGEPTLRKDIHELMRYTESLGCVCNLTTNGWFLTENFVKEMAKTGIKQCQVSLDSFNEEIHDRLRGKGSLKNVINAIKLLHEYGIHVGIDCVVSNNNINDIPNMIKKCEEMKIEYVTLIKIKKGDLSEDTFNKLVPAYEDYGKIIETFCNRVNKMPNVTLDCASISNLQYTLKEEELKSIPTAGCPVGHNLIAVAPNGDLYPCAALMQEESKLGNALNDDLPKLWKENSLLRNLRNIKKNIRGKCKNCPRLDFCRAGCRGIAYTLNKDMLASDNTCQFKTMEVQQNGKDYCRFASRGALFLPGRNPTKG